MSGLGIQRKGVSPIFLRLLLFSSLPAGLLAITLLLAGNFPRDVWLSTLLILMNAFAGALIWISTRRARSITEAVAVGYGLALVVPSAVLFLEAQRLPGLISWLALPAGAVIFALLARPGSPRRPEIPAETLILISGLVAAIAALILFRGALLTYSAGNNLDLSRFHPDVVTLQAIVQANPSEGLGQIGLMSEWPARYHWVAYAWAGSLEQFLNSSVFFAQAQFLPVFSILSIALLTSALAWRIARRRWVPPLAALTVLIGRPIADSSGLVVNWDSPSQLSSGVALILAVLLVVSFTQRPTRWLGLSSLIPVSFLLTGIKASAGAVLLGALAIPAISFGYLRSHRRQALLAAAAFSTLGAGTFWLLFQSGQETGGLLDLRNVSLQLAMAQPWTTAQVFELALWRTASIIPACAGIIFLLSRRSQLARSAGLLALGALTFGLIPIWLFDEGAPNSSWFLASAMTIVGSFSAAGAAKVLTWVSPNRRTLSVPVFGLVVTVAVLTTWALLVRQPNTIWQSLGPLLVIPLWTLISLLAALILRAWNNNPYPPSKAFVAVLVTSGVLMPIGVVANEMLFGSELPRGGYTIQSDESTDLTGPKPKGFSKSATELAEQLSQNLDPGSIVGFTDQAFLAPALLAQLRPFSTGESWTSLIGPVGTYDEFLFRQSQVDLAIDSADRQARANLCEEGVRALLSRVESNVNEVRIEILDCSPKD